jgi:transcription termination/antitermination protein NusA
VAKALSPAKVKEVRIDEYEGRAEVIVPDYQLSLAIGKEGQNARLAARLTGWRVDIKSETQLAEEESYKSEEWAQGEWVIDPTSGEQVWQPADGGDAMSAEQWNAGGDSPDDPDGDGVPGADEVVASEVAAANDVTEAGGPTDVAEIEPEPSAEELAMHVETEEPAPPAPTDDPAAPEDKGSEAQA